MEHMVAVQYFQPPEHDRAVRYFEDFATMSRIRCYIGTALALLLLAGRGLSANLPPAIAALPLNRLVSGAVTNASPVFLSEDTLTLLLRSAARPGTSKIVLLRIANGQVQVVAETDRTYEGDQVFSVSKGRLLIAGTRNKYLYSQDLHQKWELTMKVLGKQFPRTDIIGEGGSKGEKAFRLTIPPTPVNRGAGDLLAVADDVLVYQTEDEIRTAAADGATRGSIPITPESRYFNNVEVAGPGRLYFSAAGDEHITDLNGKMIVRVEPPNGWGFRHGWSSDGSRLLFDRYLHNVPLGERVVGAIFDALGTVLPEEANGEVVRVIDVSTGAICLNLESPGALLGQAGGYHADLSPSGGLVAIATLTELTVYRLPTMCSKE